MTTMKDPTSNRGDRWWRKTVLLVATRSIENDPQAWRAEPPSRRFVRLAGYAGAEVREGMTRCEMADAIRQAWLLHPSPVEPLALECETFLNTPEAEADRSETERLMVPLRARLAVAADPSEGDEPFRQLMELELAWRRKWQRVDFGSAALPTAGASAEPKGGHDRRRPRGADGAS